MSSLNSNNATTSALPIIGILGDGQLAMMMAQAYQSLGGQTYIFAEGPNGPASKVADKLIIGSTSQIEDLVKFFSEVDVVTLENEFIDSQLLIDATKRSNTQMAPRPDNFKLIEDKLSENLFFQNLGVDIADFYEVKEVEDLIEQPGYLKLAKGGYDGIGTYKVSNKQEATEVFNRIKSSGTVLFEHQIEFDKELSLIAVANSNDIVFYPLVETHQEEGTCRYVSFPSGVTAEIEQEAQSQVGKIMRALDTRGLFAFELFLTKDNRLMLNESAPRPHNSGHITLDLMDCSQFENHMRAVADLPLVTPSLKQQSMMMVNLLGTRDGPFDEEQVTSQISDENLSTMFYRKQQSRIKRKMGHINLWGPDQKQRAEQLVKQLTV